MRNNDPLTEQLRRWGHAQENRFALSRANRSVHVLDKVRDHAPLARERAMQDLVGRDGESPRRFKAARSGVQGMQMLPTWAVDPVRAANDADKPHDNGIDGPAIPPSGADPAHGVHGFCQPSRQGHNGGRAVRWCAIDLAMPSGAAARGRLHGRTDCSLGG